MSLKDLQGKVVVLDFWTYGCINCLHVAEELKTLEKRFGNRLVVIGVHTPKFDNERNLDTLRRNILRYDLRHPVIQDEGALLMEAYDAPAWPTLAVIDPSGLYVARLIGEGKAAGLGRLIDRLLEIYRDSIDDTPIPLALEQLRPGESGLAGPGKVAAGGGIVAISDTLHHRIVVADTGGKVLAVFGNGEAGFAEGDAEQALFSSPQGLAVDTDHNRIYVADAGNHAVRMIDLTSSRVSTLAGTGELGRQLSTVNDEDSVKELRSPWALALDGDRLYVAMAGSHQIWRLDLDSGDYRAFSGSAREGLVDGAAPVARFSQPSGLSIVGRSLLVADAEASAIRRVDLETGAVETLTGSGLHDFGDRDGSLAEASLQHPAGILVLDASTALVADTYNHKLKKLDLVEGRVTTLAGSGHPGAGEGGALGSGLNEPSGLARLGDAVLVADSNNDRLLRYDPVAGTLEVWPLVWPSR